MFNFDGFLNISAKSTVFAVSDPLFGGISPTSSELISELRSRRYKKLVTGTKYIVSTLPKKIRGIPGSKKNKVFRGCTNRVWFFAENGAGPTWRA